LRSHNENGAGFPIGTVCLFRREVLDRVGGWATWCVTEDSELGIRFNAAGYTSLILNETFGRGLVPETFAAYKKQRYRWTFGPAQSMRRHWRLYLPRRWTTPLRLTTRQKAFDIFPTLTQAGRVSTLFTPAAAVAVLTSGLAHGESVAAIPMLWFTVALGFAVRAAMRWCLCRRGGGRATPPSASQPNGGGTDTTVQVADGTAADTVQPDPQEPDSTGRTADRAREERHQQQQSRHSRLGWPREPRDRETVRTNGRECTVRVNWKWPNRRRDTEYVWGSIIRTRVNQRS